MSALANCSVCRCDLMRAANVARYPRARLAFCAHCEAKHNAPEPNWDERGPDGTLYPFGYADHLAYLERANARGEVRTIGGFRCDKCDAWTAVAEWRTEMRGIGHGQAWRPERPRICKTCVRARAEARGR